MSSPLCRSCGAEFGVMTWKHRCAVCDQVFCSDCRNHAVRLTNRDKMHLCRLCYNTNYAFLVTYNLFITGFRNKSFNSLEAALAEYKSIPRYASRQLMKVGDGSILHSYYKRDAWKLKVQEYANIHRAKLLQGYGFGSPTPSPAPTPQASTIPSTRNARAMVGVMVMWNQTDALSMDHHWVLDEGPPSEVIRNAVALLHSIPSMVGGAVVAGGAVAHQVGTIQRDTATSYAAQCRLWKYTQGSNALASVSSLLVGTEEIILSNRGSLLMDGNGNIVALAHCTVNQAQTLLAPEAGRLMLREQKIMQLALVVGPSYVERTDDLNNARCKLVSATSPSAIFAQTSPTSTPSLLQKSPFFSRSAVLELQPLAVRELQRGYTELRHRESQGSRTSTTSISLECSICYCAYTTTDRKPCICPSCGNTLCLTCLRSVDTCPSCRNPIPRNRPITNVQLLHLIGEPS